MSDAPKQSLSWGSNRQRRIDERNLVKAAAEQAKANQQSLQNPGQTVPPPVPQPSRQQQQPQKPSSFNEIQQQQMQPSPSSSSSASWSNSNTNSNSNSNYGQNFRNNYNNKSPQQPQQQNSRNTNSNRNNDHNNNNNNNINNDPDHPAFVGRETGCIKVLREGFGFITCAERDVDVFFPNSELPRDPTSNPTEGSSVSFDVGWRHERRTNEWKMSASKLEIISGDSVVWEKDFSEDGGKRMK